MGYCRIPQMGHPLGLAFGVWRLACDCGRMANDGHCGAQACACAGTPCGGAAAPPPPDAGVGEQCPQGTMLAERANLYKHFLAHCRASAADIVCQDSSANMY